MERDPETERVRRERDLFRRLLDVGMQEDLPAFLREALGLITELTGARRGYLEVGEGDAEGDGERSFSLGCSEEEVEGIRRATSRGIIAEALASGRTVHTASAMADPRFARKESVRAMKIQAVLCAPVGGDPPLGVVYLQERIAGGAFTHEDRECLEVFARRLAPLAESLLIQRRAERTEDPTAPWRARLEVGGMVGRSAALARVFREAAGAAPLDVGVFLTGPSGTGKSALARAIHASSRRRAGPFVELNASAIPETLLESELFGALPGAHSTATVRIPGKVAAARGGTLFLDEVAEMPPSAQAKLLQLLQDRTYFPLGATVPERADVRLIAATNADLDEAVRERRLRRDLLYRLDVLRIRMPPLEERRDDVPLLAAHFAAAAAAEHGLPPRTLAPAAQRALEAAPWPGHVRQLGNLVTSAAIRASSEGSAAIEPRHLFPPREDDGEAGTGNMADAMGRFQRDLLRRALEETAWDTAETARRLGVARSQVYRLIKVHGLERQH